MEEVSGARRVGRVAAYPMIRLLEPRFADLVRRLTDAHRSVREEGERTRSAVAGIEPLIAHWAATSAESMAFVGAELRELADEVRAASAPSAARVAPELGGVAEAFALLALGRLGRASRIIDIGGAERPLGQHLVSMGFDVLGVDPRPYRHAHPALRVRPTGIDAWDDADDPYDAAVALDPPEDADAATRLLERVRTRLTPQGLMVLALEAGTEVPLRRWRVIERVQLREDLPGVWAPVPEPQQRGVVLVAAVAT